ALRGPISGRPGRGRPGRPRPRVAMRTAAALGVMAWFGARPRCGATALGRVTRDRTSARRAARALGRVPGHRAGALPDATAARRIPRFAAGAVGAVPRGVSAVVPLDPALAVVRGSDVDVLHERNDRNINITVLRGRALELVQQ